MQLSNTFKGSPPVKDKNTSVSASVSTKQRMRDYQVIVFATLNLRKLAASCKSALHHNVEAAHYHIDSLTVHG